VISAGVLLFRRRAGALEVFLVHPGGPFFAAKHEGAWSIPKGVVEDGEEPLAAARRELLEETGVDLDACAAGAVPIDLGTVRQKGGKIVRAFAVEGDWPEGAEVRSNTFSLEWPPRSGRMREFPEVDRAGFFSIEEARRLLNPAQASFLDVLLERLR
jgi:predicted NUDIX family NTP pyrophosphohydrolase